MWHMLTLHGVKLRVATEGGHDDPLDPLTITEALVGHEDIIGLVDAYSDLEDDLYDRIRARMQEDKEEREIDEYLTRKEKQNEYA